MLNFRLSLLAFGLASTFVSYAAQAQTTSTTTTTPTGTTTVVEKRTIVTPAPKGNCTTIAAHWEGNEWRDTYTLCKYENRKEGIAWISDYWSCSDYTANGNCTTWALVPGHWVNTAQ